MISIKIISANQSGPIGFTCSATFMKEYLQDIKIRQFDLFKQNYYVIIIICATIVVMQTCQRSSFHQSANESHAIHANLLDQACYRLISDKQRLQVSHVEDIYYLQPHFLKLISSFYHSLSQSNRSGKVELKKSGQNEYEITVQDSIQSHNIKYQLFKLILTALQKKLFLSRAQNKFYEQVSYSLSMKATLLPFFLSIISQNTNFIPMQRVNSFYRNLTSEQYPLYIPIQLYFLFGGSLFTIQSKRFKQKVINLIESIAKVLAHSETFIGRNAEFYKNQRERKLVLDQSVKIVMLAKNKENLEETAQNIINNIFSGREYLSKQEFLHIIQSKPLDPTLTIFLLLLRTQFMLMQQKTFQSYLLSRSQVEKPNFYAHQMTKLFNKCPFNGDQRCSCKKCQCVRRNRESAKLNQQKKRNAVEQVQSMKKRIQQLQQKDKANERKIGQLEQQNQMLKTLLKEIKMNHTMKQSLLQTIQPFSKVLNNEL